MINIVFSPIGRMNLFSENRLGKNNLTNGSATILIIIKLFTLLFNLNMSKKLCITIYLEYGYSKSMYIIHVMIFFSVLYVLHRHL